MHRILCSYLVIAFAGPLLQGTKQKTEGDAEYKAAQAKGYGEF